MKEKIYKDLILYHWKHPKNFGTLKNPQKKVVLENSFCGDKIKMEATFKKGKVEKIRFSGQGCIISLATASLLTEYAKKKRISELKKLNKEFILNLISFQLSPTRLKCALLPLEALHKLLVKNK